MGSPWPLVGAGRRVWIQTQKRLTGVWGFPKLGTVEQFLNGFRTVGSCWVVSDFSSETFVPESLLMKIPRNVVGSFLIVNFLGNHRSIH
jgi:hypothetical protein